MQDKLIQAQRDLIEFYGKHISELSATLLNMSWFKLNQADIDKGIELRAKIAALESKISDKIFK